MNVLIIPAIDLHRGRCVRLTQGRREAEEVFSDDPLAVAWNWVAQGAPWLHVVDLDAALGNESPNLPLVERICRAVPIPVQFGGGLRDDGAVERAMAMGVARVVIGTRALQPDGADFLRRLIGWYGADHIVVALDEREGLVALHGWQAVSTMPVLEAAKRVQAAGVARIVYTDTARDGMLSGVNPEPIYRLAMETGLAIIAAGGISSLADIRTLMSIPGVEAAIIGKALYTGDILLSAALAMVRETPC